MPLRRFYDAGMPTETPTFNKTLCEESERLADKWASAAAEGEEKLADVEAAKFEAWTSPQKVRCLCNEGRRVCVCVIFTATIGCYYCCVGMSECPRSVDRPHHTAFNVHVHTYIYM